MNIFKPSHGIAFDIDGIVLDTATYIWKAVMDHLGRDWPIERWTHYDIEQVIGIPTVELRHVYEPIIARNDMPMVAGAKATLQWLHAQYPEEELLFITSRRPQFKQAAISSISKEFGGHIPFKVVCTAEADREFEYRNDKLATLQEHGVTFYMEDNPMYWDRYLDAGVNIATLNWPWTKDDFIRRMFKYDLNKPTTLYMFTWPEIIEHFKREGLSWMDRHKTEIKKYTK